MKKLFAAAVVLSLAVGPAFAAGKKAPMSEEEMMKKWAEMATPGAPHKDLAKSVGKWNANVKMWMAPDAPVMESKGTADFHATLGGRWIVQDFTGEFMGKPFHGMGQAGYDNFKKLYVATWQDDMSTAMFQMTGSPTKDGKGVEYWGLMDEPATGEKGKKIRSVVRWENDDTMVYESWDKAAGKTWMAMQITYARQK
jgi:hypothetical protein